MSAELPFTRAHAREEARRRLQRSKLDQIQDPAVRDLLEIAEAHALLCGDHHVQRAGVWADCACRLAVYADRLSRQGGRDG